MSARAFPYVGILKKAPSAREQNPRLRFILIGERFFHNFQSLEIIGDMYQNTEAFYHNS